LPTSSRGPRRRSGRRIVYLDEKDVAYAIHRLAASSYFPAERYGEGMPGFVLRGPEGLALFEAAINLPRQPYLRTKHEKAAALFRSLIKNYPLLDGNKRLAVVALDVFLTINGSDMHVTPTQLVDGALAVASYPGNFPLEVVTRWIRGLCTGRPRTVVRELAEEWPETRRLLTAEARAADLAVGRRPRVPGRRVRIPAQVWAQVRAVIENRDS
jgi:Fic/DOC family